MIRRRFLKIVLHQTAAAFIAGTATATSAAMAGEAKKKGGGPGYTQFPSINVFTQGNQRSHGTMSIDMGLYCEDPKLSDTVKLYIPRLRDAYLMRMQSYAASLTASSLVDPDYVTVQLQQATDQVVGHKGAKVLLGSILLN